MQSSDKNLENKEHLDKRGGIHGYIYIGPDNYPCSSMGFLFLRSILSSKFLPSFPDAWHPTESM